MLSAITSVKAAATETPSKALATQIESTMSLFDEDWDASPPSGDLDKNEKLLIPNNKRFVLFPIQYHNIWSSYKNAEARFWSAEEIELSDDLPSFEKLSGKEKAAVLHALSLLCIIDVIDTEPFIQKLSDTIQCPEARCFFGFQIMQRNIHTEFFNLALSLFENEEEKRDFLFDSLRELPSVSKRAAWIQMHITDSSEPFAVRMLAYATYFCIFNTAAVSMLLHVPGATMPENKKHMLPGVTHGLYKLISDHQRCVEFAKIVMTELTNKVAAATAHALIREAVAIELDVAKEIITVSGGSLMLNGTAFSVSQVKERLQTIADRSLRSLNFPEMYGTVRSSEKDSASAPVESLSWIDSIIAHFAKSEHKEEEGPVFQPANPVGTPAKDAREFSLEEDF